MKKSYHQVLGIGITILYSSTIIVTNLLLSLKILIHFMQPSSTPVVILFNDAFLGFMADAVPFASSPHMFLSYLDQWYVFIS